MQRSIRSPHQETIINENTNIPIIDPYHAYFVTSQNISNLEPLKNFSLIFNADKTIPPIIYLGDLTIFINSVSITFDYNIYNNTNISKTISYSTLSSNNTYLFIRENDNLYIYINNNLITTFKLYFVFPNNWNFTFTNISELKLYNINIDVYNLSLTNILTATNSTNEYLYLITSQFTPTDEISGRYIYYNNTYNPISKSFRFAEIDLFENEFTLKFTVLNYLSNGVIIKINNGDFNFSYNNSKINNITFTQQSVNYIELCNQRGQIKLFINGTLIHQVNLTNSYIFKISLEKMEFCDLEIIKGVYSQNHIPVRFSKINKLNKFYETDKIHFKSVNNYSKYDLTTYNKETVIDIIPNSTNSITLNSFYEVSPLTSATSKDSNLVSLSNFTKTGNIISGTVNIGEYFDALLLPKKISYQTEIENQVVILNNIDPRITTFVWDVQQYLYFLDGYFPSHNINKTLKGISTTVNNFVNDYQLPTSVYTNNTSYIQFNQTINNVSSFLLIYKEITPTNFRGYVGNSNNGIVNGGDNGKIIGNINLSNTDYFNIKNITGVQSSSVSISETGNLVVVNDYLNDLIQIYERNNENYVFVFAINTVNSNNNLGFSLSARITCISDTKILLGLKDATLDGRGRVQIWEKINEVWTRTLDLNSPLLSEQGFGLSVDLDTNTDYLYVGELSTDVVYVFEKLSSGIYNTSPIQTLEGGHQIQIGTDYIYARNAYDTLFLYNKTNFTLEYSFNNVNTFAVSKTENKFAISNFTLNIVTIYENDLPIVNLNPPDIDSEFGFSLSFSSNNNLAISSPNVNKVYLYDLLTNYTNYQTFQQNQNLYGYDIELENEYLIVSDFNSVVYIYTRDPNFIGTNVNNVYVNGLLKSNNSTLDQNNLDIDFIHINLKSPHNVEYIGLTNTNLFLNGYVLGFLAFNRNLNESEILSVQESVLKYLKMKQYYMYFT